MPNSDRMLFAADVFSRGFIPYAGGYISVTELMETARMLQGLAMKKKLAGDHQGAVALYRELLPMVRHLDELNVLPGPTGLASQIAQRAIELEEEQILGQTFESQVGLLSTHGPDDSAN